MSFTKISIPMNNDDPVFASFGYYISKHMLKDVDESKISFIQIPENLEFRIIGRQRTSIFKSYFLPETSSSDPIIFIFNGIKMTMDIKLDKKIIILDINKFSNFFGEMIITFPKGEEDVFRSLIKLSAEFFNEFGTVDSEEDFTNIYIGEEFYWELLERKRKRSLNSIYLPEKDTQKIINDLVKFYDPKTITQYERLGLTHKRVFLFEGIPGSGKTSFIAALAGKFGYNLSILHFNGKLDDNMFMQLIKNLPKKTWVVLEDMDYLFQDRKSQDSSKNAITISGILNVLDGIVTRDGFVAFLSTNFKNHLDPALIRPGRIDTVLHFGYAIKEQIYNLYKNFMGSLFSNEHFELFYDHLQDYSKDSLTIGLLTQYLIPYIENPQGCLENLSTIVTLAQSSKTCSIDVQNMYM